MFMLIRKSKPAVCVSNRYDSANKVYRMSSVTDSFYKESAKSSVSGKEYVRYTDPIIMLFNQQRVEKMLGTETAATYFDTLMSHFNSDALAQLRSKCSDDALLHTIKSRHLQAPSEVLTWCRYVNRNFNKFQDEIASAQQSLQAQEPSIPAQSNE